MKLALLLLVPAVLAAQEESIPVSKLPPEIRAAVEARFRTLEVQVAADGSKILKEEVKKPGDPND